MLSSLITLCNLWNLPDILFVYPLEWLTHWWLYVAQLPMPNCMITFIEPPLFLALCAPLGATGIILSGYFSTQERKIAGLTALYIFLMLAFSLHHVPTSVTVPYGSSVMTITYQDKKLTMTDPGFTRRTSGIQQWINYTLLPTIGNKFGRQTIDKLIVQKQSPSAVACAELLRKQGVVTSVFLVDAPAKTKPSSHVVPPTWSKNPSSQNLPALPRRVLPRAWRR